MTASYRLLFFSPDPFLGARFPLGAVLHVDGVVRIVRAPHLPGTDCLGGADLAVAVRRLHARLDSIESADTLPPAFGPYATLSERRSVPPDRDAVEWVEHLFARPTTIPGDVEHRGPNRASIGFRFFDTWHVGKYVSKTFHAASDWSGWLAGRPGLRPVSHWVGGHRELLLLEPIVPARPQLDADLDDVAARFMAYGWALTEVGDRTRECQMLAYVTAGGSPRQREKAFDTLARGPLRVVDTDDETARGQLLSLVRRVGAEAKPGLDFVEGN